jgi:hypothetical protein
MFVAFALSAMGADLAGTWKATAEGQNGTMERTFVFKVDGQKLTGETTSSMLGKSEIQDGKIDGDSFSFTISAKLGDNELKLIYKGKVSGNEIQLTSQMAGGSGGQTFQWKGKRAS